MTSPVHFLLALVLALGLQQFFGLPVFSGNWQHVSHVLGTLLANIGLLLALWCIWLFWQRRTTLMPGGSPSRLVIRGPYRYSRNPMYLSLVLSYLGLALMLDVPWGWLTGMAALWLLHNRVIPHEEAVLRTQFGRDYDDYQQRVRRWL
ncbi:protein-S-isoprenylcysteine methyltransferase [Lysobacteraceae bacterium NML07-0707]|nr:protein-S-isoprenylcysteine methyltransferase [Xanthomonadaceae bacterium NML07-0707]